MYSSNGSIGSFWRGQAHFQTGIEIERRLPYRATVRATAGHAAIAAIVRSGLKRRDGSDVHFRRIVFQIVIEKRTQDMLAKVQRRVAIEFDRAERTAVAESPDRDAMDPSPETLCRCLCPWA